VSIADLPFRCAGGTPAAISLGPIMPINEPIDTVYATTEIPIARFQAPFRTPMQVA